MKHQLNSLYIVSTPIGNLDDITLRAIEVLKDSDIIVCEDTRHSFKLLNHLKIKKKLISYHKFNERKKFSEIIQYINQSIIKFASHRLTGVTDSHVSSPPVISVL